MKVFGQLEKAQIENVTVDPTLGTPGTIVLRTDTEVIKVDIGSVIEEVILSTQTQVLSNKDIDGGTASNSNRLTIPKDTKANLDALTRKEGTIAFATDEDTIYVDNGTVLVPIITDVNVAALTNKDIDGGTASDTSRITLPKDTFANLDALTRKEGTILYATDSSQAYIDDGSQLIPIGTGGGGQNFYSNGDAEFISTVRSGNNASFGGGGTVQGTAEVSSSSPLIGGQSFLFTANATPGNSDNDYIQSLAGDIFIEPGFRGRELNFEIQSIESTFAANEVKLVVRDDTNGVILEEVTLPKTGGPFPAQISFFCPNTCSNVSVGMQVISHATGSETFKFDGVIVNADSGLVDIYNAKEWQDSGELITVEATTTNPTKASNLEKDQILFRDTGNVSRFKYIYRTDTVATGAAAGSGDYLFSLPLGKSFDSSGVDFYTGSIGAVSANDVQWRGLGFGQFIIDGVVSSQEMAIVPYDSTRFRIFYLDSSNNFRWFGSASFSLISVNAGFYVEFEAPMAGQQLNTSHFLSNAVSGANWQDTGTTIQIDALTTAPTKGTVTTDKVFYQRRANKGIFKYTYRQSTAGTNGVGEYLFSLPIIDGVQLEFDPNLVDFYTTAITNHNANGHRVYGNVHGEVDGSSHLQEGGIIPYDATQFRVLLSTQGGVSSTWDSAFYQLGVANLGVTLEFEVPIKDWTIENQFTVLQPAVRTAIVKDVKASGTAGGTFTAGSYQTRDLNTIEGDSSFVSLSSNQFTLQPGAYEIEAEAPALYVNQHKAKLRNITDSLDTVIGSVCYAPATVVDSATNYSKIRARLELTKATTFEIQHRCTTTLVTNGYGRAASFGDDEVFTQVKINKLK